VLGQLAKFDRLEVQTLTAPMVRVQRQSPETSLPQTVAAAHSWQVPPVQKALAQSCADAQPCPLTQRGQEPPQSTPVSLPFLRPSLQVGGAGVIGGGATQFPL
jgi:hypothetical protein